jgi:formamidopyrimidine-DNA glycosylase
MPELPEVEVLRRDLERAVLGRTITDAWVAPDAARLVQEMPVAAFVDGLRGRRIEAVHRRGKFLLIQLDHGLWWLVHRRMSGNLIHRPQGAPGERYLRARFRLDDGTELRFVDLRKFGTMWLTDDPGPILADLGPEPLDPSFTPDVLADVLARRSAPVKAVLMDQRAVAGLGNLYADEALHYAGVHPLRPANTLPREEVVRLREGIVRALHQGLRNLGSSLGARNLDEVAGGEPEPMVLRDHVNLNGEPGSNQEHLVSYGREGRPCRTCGAPIERVKLGNRSAYFCPRCQPLDGARPRRRTSRSGRKSSRAGTSARKSR